MKNPPAFPRQITIGPGSENHNGMTLRDWFAGQALAALQPDMDYGFPTPEQCNDAAVHAYRMADAMLEARGGQL